MSATAVRSRAASMPVGDDLRTPSTDASATKRILKKRPSTDRGNNVSSSACSRQRGPMVTFSEKIDYVLIPSDQMNPVDVWNSYAQVGYVSKKEQRRLQKVREVQARDIRECFYSLIQNSDKDSSATSVERSHHSRLTESRKKKRIPSRIMEELGYGAADGACISLIMSIAPTFPISLRPVLTAEVERAIEKVFNGMKICVFNEIINVPMRCTSAFRLLRNFDDNEGSIAIFTKPCDSIIEGYIPLAFIDAVTEGLEKLEKLQFLTPENTIVSTEPDGTGKTIPLCAARSFTLHCSGPQRFYVTFVAFTDNDYETWLLATRYFATLNSKRRAYEAP